MKLNKSEEALPSEFKKISINQNLRSIRIWCLISFIVVMILYFFTKSNGLFT